MFVQLSHEIELKKVGACKAWELYGTIKLPLLARKALSHVLLHLDILEGDGGIGTVMKLTFVGGLSYKEKITKVDNERRVKEVEMIEGGYLDMGVSLYRVRFQVVGKDEEESCVIKSTVEYQVADEASFDVSRISLKPYADLAEAAKKQLTAPAAAN